MKKTKLTDEELFERVKFRALKKSQIKFLKSIRRGILKEASLYGFSRKEISQIKRYINARIEHTPDEFEKNNKQIGFITAKGEFLDKVWVRK